VQAAQLARALGAKRSGNQWSCRCPAHEDSAPSLIFWDGHTSIRFKCYAGCEPEDVIAALKRRGLWNGAATDRERPAKSGTDRQNPAPNGPERNYRDLALGIWRSAEPLMGSPAAIYLTQRGLPVAPALGVARFHPACPRGRDRQGALIVLMRSIHDGVPCAIQRIFLTGDYRKDGKPMMLGPAGSAAMKLAPMGPRLTICEGFETALGLHANGFAPVWALGSAGAIERFPLIAGIDELIIGADHDPVGLKSAEVCLRRWRARARIKKIDREGADFADLAREQKR